MSYFLPSLLPECSEEAAALSGHKMKTAELKVIFIFILKEPSKVYDKDSLVAPSDKTATRSSTKA